MSGIIFGTQLSKLERALKTVEGPPLRQESPAFDLEKFWLNYGLGVGKLSDGMKALGEAEGGDLSREVRSVEASYTGLLVAYTLLPASVGASLHSFLSATTANIFKALLQYFTACSYQPKEKIRVGVVLAYCEEAYKLPRDNKAAVLSSLAQQVDLLRDALDELKQEAGSDDEEGEDSEKLGELRGSVQATGELLVSVCKYSGEALCGMRPSGMDSVLRAVTELSPALDEIVSSLVPPSDLESSLQQFEELYKAGWRLFEVLGESRKSTGVEENPEETRLRSEWETTELSLAAKGHVPVPTHLVKRFDALNIKPS